MSKVAGSFGREPTPRLEVPAVRDVQVDAATIGSRRAVIQGFAPVQRSEGADRGAVERLAVLSARGAPYAFAAAEETEVAVPEIEQKCAGQDSNLRPAA